MTKLLTSNFHTHMADQFIESFDESANTIYYIFAGKSSQFDSDLNPPNPDKDIFSRFYQSYRDMVFGKHILPNDVSLMIKENRWNSGTIYDIYDDKDENLESKKFYVTVFENGSEYNVFKCLNNNDGSPSTTAPSKSETNAEDEFYSVGDGYQWKYMFSVTSSTYNKFATNGYLPLVEDTNVTANSIPGTINTIIVENPGINYNSYAKGVIKESSVSGNTLAYSLIGDSYSDVDIVLSMTATGDNFDNYTNELVIATDSNGRKASGIVLDADSDNNRLRLTRVRGEFKTGSIAKGQSSNTEGTILSVTRLSRQLSSNTDFYKNSTIYISSGNGSGQVRTITEYTVTGDNRIVYVNTPFNPIPEQDDEFVITPRVLIDGDGDNAEAIATINTVANSIMSIEMINSGNNYTYANVTILANTGLQDTDGVSITANTADVRAIISPPNGHGSDVKNELFASRVGIGTQFDGSEANTIVVANDYRQIGILKEPLFANTVLTVSSTIGFESGQTIIQANTKATGVITARNFDGDSTLRIGDIRGFFTTGETITSSNSTNNSIASANVTTVDRSLETFEQLYKYTVDILSTGLSGNGFQEDDVVTQGETGATGVVYAIQQENGVTTISLSNVKGFFSITDAATGVTQTFRNQDGAEAELTGEIKPDVKPYSGEIIYLENFSPITRDSNQTEKIKLILGF